METPGSAENTGPRYMQWAPFRKGRRSQHEGVVPAREAEAVAGVVAAVEEGGVAGHWTRVFWRERPRD